ncbi:MAG: metal ABC transporter substrate-binding protein [Coprobacillaceae bacterium]
MKKWISIFCSVLLVLSLSACDTKQDKTEELKIVTSNFPGYDFARAVVGNEDTIDMLLKPGQESHSYDPTPQDIVKISEADIFIYTGGESDTWVDEMLKTIDNEDLVCIRMMDYVDVYEEEIVEGMQEDEHVHDDDHDHDDHEHEDEEHNHEDEGEYDEHVWTSPKNAITIIEAIEKAIINIDSNNEKTYQDNTDSYIKQIEEVDASIREVVNNGTTKEIIFGDRFPFRYFVEEYGLTYYAAFPGCSEQTEVDAKTIAFLVSKVEEDNIPVIFHIELSNTNIATTISNETGVKVLQFHSIHNLTESEFTSGKTYIDFMKENIENLKEALH